MSFYCYQCESVFYWDDFVIDEKKRAQLEEEEVLNHVATYHGCECHDVTRGHDCEFPFIVRLFLYDLKEYAYYDPELSQWRWYPRPLTSQNPQRLMTPSYGIGLNYFPIPLNRHIMSQNEFEYHIHWFYPHLCRDIRRRKRHRKNEVQKLLDSSYLYRGEMTYKRMRK